MPTQQAVSAGGHVLNVESFEHTEVAVARLAISPWAWCAHVTPGQLEALYVVPGLKPGHQYGRFLREGIRIVTTRTGLPARERLPRSVSVRRRRPAER